MKKQYGIGSGQRSFTSLIYLYSKDIEMADILSVPLKKTSEIDLVKPLKNLIALRFSTADNPENFNDAISEMNKLRSLACVRALDKNESSIEINARYLFAIINVFYILK